jgi:FAD/FMN-containing dehydrogenase
VAFTGAPALSYHSLMQQERVPTCRVEPYTSEDITYILSIVQNEEACHFAVRGGGHGTVPGASNARGGITIDLARLFFVELSPDRASVRVVGGARWVDIYRKLDPLGLSMNGGRTGCVSRCWGPYSRRCGSP